ncbi:hypothetical protein QJQ45_012336 [Haematococcus lacustris]|nr:hypothetical protein QJQ45_012336 [Haematococcus lacustris]
MDFVVKLPKTAAGHDSILVIVDRLTKMVHLAPTVEKVNGEDVARLFYDNVFKLHGMPLEIISDRDPRFRGQFFSGLCDIMQTKQCLSTAFHPQSDGQTERMNKVMEDMLRHYVGVEYVDWDKFLSSAEFAINNSYNSSIGTTPFRLNNVKDPNVPVTLKLDATTNNAAQNFARVMKDNLEKAKLALDAARKRQKAYYDLMHRDENEIVVGSEVLLRTKHLKFKNPGSPKLLPLYIGPFQVTQKVNDVAFRIKLPETFKIHDVFHVSKFKPFLAGPGMMVPPPPLEEGDGLYFTVNHLLQHRKNKQGRDEYLVRWSGYGPEHDTSALTHTEEIQGEAEQQFCHTFVTIKAHIEEAKDLIMYARHSTAISDLMRKQRKDSGSKQKLQPPSNTRMHSLATMLDSIAANRQPLVNLALDGASPFNTLPMGTSQGQRKRVAGIKAHFLDESWWAYNRYLRTAMQPLVKLQEDLQSDSANLADVCSSLLIILRHFRALIQAAYAQLGMFTATGLGLLAAGQPGAGQGQLAAGQNTTHLIFSELMRQVGELTLLTGSLRQQFEHFVTTQPVATPASTPLEHSGQSAPPAPPAATSAPLPFRPPPPPSFCGTPNADAGQWLWRIDNHFDLFAMPAQQRLLAVASYLDGAALTWYRSLLSSQALGSWDSFKASFMRQFTPVNQQWHARDQLAACHQITSARQYIMEFSNLCLLISDLSPAEKLDRFLRGLKPAVRRELELREPTSFEEAAAMADCVDAITFGSRPRLLKLPEPEPVAAMELDALQVSKGPRLSAAERQQLRDLGACFYCRKPGHLMKDCPNKPPRPNDLGSVREAARR